MHAAQGLSRNKSVLYTLDNMLYIYVYCGKILFFKNHINLFDLYEVYNKLEKEAINLHVDIEGRQHDAIISIRALLHNYKFYVSPHGGYDASTWTWLSKCVLHEESKLRKVIDKEDISSKCRLYNEREEIIAHIYSGMQNVRSLPKIRTNIGDMTAWPISSIGIYARDA